jgi:hypothetical protein
MSCNNFTLPTGEIVACCAGVKQPIQSFDAQNVCVDSEVVNLASAVIFGVFSFCVVVWAIYSRKWSNKKDVVVDKGTPLDDSKKSTIPEISRLQKLGNTLVIMTAITGLIDDVIVHTQFRYTWPSQMLLIMWVFLHTLTTIVVLRDMAKNTWMSTLLGMCILLLITATMITFVVTSNWTTPWGKTFLVYVFMAFMMCFNFSVHAARKKTMTVGLKKTVLAMQLLAVLFIMYIVFYSLSQNHDGVLNALFVEMGVSAFKFGNNFLITLL